MYLHRPIHRPRRRAVAPSASTLATSATFALCARPTHTAGSDTLHRMTPDWSAVAQSRQIEAARHVQHVPWTQVCAQQFDALGSRSLLRRPRICPDVGVWPIELRVSGRRVPRRKHSHGERVAGFSQEEGLGPENLHPTHTTHPAQTTSRTKPHTRARHKSTA